MHEQFANAFYGSQAWKDCRREYRMARGGLCERCLARGLIVTGTEVHHRVRLTPENMRDPRVTLNWENLELLCAECHDMEHRGEDRIRTDKNGHVDL